MKGRPPGTKKSDDPNKKKRKRQARERDQCDVKIKITEYYPGARGELGAEFPLDGQIINNSAGNGQLMENQPPGNHTSPVRPDGTNLDASIPGADGARFYTIQRVNGNGANGKGDGTTGGHRHSLEESDKIKKNSIHRHFLKEDKERRKSTVSDPYSLSTCVVLFAQPGFITALNERAFASLSFFLTQIRYIVLFPHFVIVTFPSWSSKL